MISSSARFVDDRPGRILKRLCVHFSHKIPAEWDEREGLLTFEIGMASLEARDDALILHCQATDEHQLHELQDVLDRHLRMLASSPAISLAWLAD